MVDPRVGRLHRYCARPACAKASHVAAQKKWLRREKPWKNPDGVDVIRMQQWRNDHPGYWRRKIRVGRYIGARPEIIRFEIGGFGKPMLLNRELIGLEFSVSHSRALIAFSFRRAIGIDIEQIADSDCDALVKSCFSNLERDALTKIPISLQRDAFYSAWVQKEAYLKAQGRGLTRQPDNFTVDIDPRSKGGLRADSEDVGVESMWYIKLLSPPHGYAAAICYEKTSQQITNIYTEEIV